MGAWQLFTPAMAPARSLGRTAVPIVAFDSKGTLRFNRAAVEVLKLKDQKRVRLYFDSARVAIEPVSNTAKEREGWPIAWAPSEKGGCRINLRPFLAYYGLAPKSGRYQFTVDEKVTGYIIVNLAEPLNGGGK